MGFQRQVLNQRKALKRGTFLECCSEEMLPPKVCPSLCSSHTTSSSADSLACPKSQVYFLISSAVMTNYCFKRWKNPYMLAEDCQPYSHAAEIHVLCWAHKKIKIPSNTVSEGESYS